MTTLVTCVMTTLVTRVMTTLVTCVMTTLVTRVMTTLSASFSASYRLLLIITRGEGRSEGEA
jgi:hypothetical protein